MKNDEKKTNDLGFSESTTPETQDWAWEILQDYKRAREQDRIAFEKANKRLVHVIVGMLITIAVFVIAFFTFFEIGSVEITSDGEGSNYNLVNSEGNNIGATP